MRLLLLAGTEDAAALAAQASTRFGRRLDLVASVAGAGTSPVPRAGAVRIGGFGGATGLAQYLRAESVDLVVDASDPFAASLSDAARRACETEAVPRLQLVPPGWPRGPLDRWIEVDTVDAASGAVRRLGREPDEEIHVVDAGERHLLARHAIDVVVLRGLGGTTPPPTLVAAREASLPVVLLRRPPPQPGDTAPTVAAALDWLATRLG